MVVALGTPTRENFKNTSLILPSSAMLTAIVKQKQYAQKTNEQQT